MAHVLMSAPPRDSYTSVLGFDMDLCVHCSCAVVGCMVGVFRREGR